MSLVNCSWQAEREGTRRLGLPFNTHPPDKYRYAMLPWCCGGGDDVAVLLVVVFVPSQHRWEGLNREEGRPLGGSYDIHPSIHPPTHPSIHPPTHPSIHPPTHTTIYPPIHLVSRPRKPLPRGGLSGYPVVGHRIFQWLT